MSHPVYIAGRGVVQMTCCPECDEKHRYWVALFKETHPRLTAIARLNKAGWPSLYWSELPSVPTAAEIVQANRAFHLWYARFAPERLPEVGIWDEFDIIPWVRKIKHHWYTEREAKRRKEGRKEGGN